MPLRSFVLTRSPLLLVGFAGSACTTGGPLPLPTAAQFAPTALDPDDSGPFGDSGDSAAAPTEDSGTEASGPGDSDGDGYPAPVDCDDTDPSVHPDAEEACDNGIDDNCDGRACRWQGGSVLLSGDRADSAGVAVAVGDVTGDGQLDLVVGAPDAVGGEFTGTVRIWTDGPPGEDTPLSRSGLNLGADPTADGAGRILLVPGDLSGDGYADLVVGTHHRPGEAPGRLAILLGPLDGAATLTRPDATLPIPDDLPLTIFVTAGPVVDGQTSLLVGAPEEGGGTVRRLDRTTEGTLDLDRATVQWTATDGQAGRALAAPGDLDGDGLEEVLIGIPGREEVAMFSAPWSDAVVDDADRFLRPAAPRTGFGTALSSAGDVDGDGHPDVLVAVVVGEGDPGRVELFCGTTLESCATFAGRSAGEQLGHDLAAPGDTEGDGHAEVALAGHGTASLGLWFGPVSGTHTIDSADASAELNGQAGFAVAAGGGHILLGAPSAGDTDPPAGGVHLITAPGF